jgi:hypothetical protein
MLIRTRHDETVNPKAGQFLAEGCQSRTVHFSVFQLCFLAMVGRSSCFLRMAAGANPQLSTD